ncbi:MAG: hypothetical protein U1A78_33700 [Polyangia bacterium]
MRPDAEVWIACLSELRARLPPAFRYRGFAPREPALGKEVGLAPGLLKDVQARLSRRALQQLDLIEALAARAARLVLTEELCLGPLIGADGLPVPATSGVIIGRRALRRFVDEHQESRQPLPWEGNPEPPPALERSAALLGVAAQAAREEVFAQHRPPDGSRRRAAQDAAYIVAALERGRPWE